MIPVLKMNGGKISVLGKMPRTLAHGPDPVLHATAVIAAVLPDGRILFADKTEKMRLKGRLSQLYEDGTVKNSLSVIDIFGGHMDFSDLTEKDISEGLSEETYRKCAARELSEELLIPDKKGILRPLPVDMDRLVLIGMYEMENDHNREISAAYLYPLEEDASYASVDTVMTSERELAIRQPVVRLSADDAIRIYEQKGQHRMFFDDAFGRIIQDDHGEKLLSLLCRQI